MKISLTVSGRWVISASVTALVLSACGGSQPPNNTPVVTPPESGAARYAAHGKAWMAPHAGGRDLLYLALGSGVNVYTYPRGTLLGSLGVGGGGLCLELTHYRRGLLIGHQAA